MDPIVGTLLPVLLLGIVILLWSRSRLARQRRRSPFDVQRDIAFRPPARPALPDEATPEWIGKVSVGATLLLALLLLPWAMGSLHVFWFRLGPIGQCVFGPAGISVGVAAVWLATAAPPGQRAWLSGRRYASRTAVALGAAIGTWSHLYRFFGPLSGPEWLVEVLPLVAGALGLICVLVQLRYVIALAKAVGARLAAIGYRIMFWVGVALTVFIVHMTVAMMFISSETTAKPKEQASPLSQLVFLAAIFALPVATQLSFVVRLWALKRSLADKGEHDEVRPQGS